MRKTKTEEKKGRGEKTEQTSQRLCFGLRALQTFFFPFNGGMIGEMMEGLELVGSDMDNSYFPLARACSLSLYTMLICRICFYALISLNTYAYICMLRVI